MASLRDDTDVEGGDGRYRARLSSDWNIWGPNGGYLAAVALRAAGAHTSLRRPASLACQFLGVADFDTVDLTVETLRATRRAEALRISMRQGDRAVLEALTWVVAEGLDGLDHDAATAPDVPDPETLTPIQDLLPAEAPPPFPFFFNFEERPVTWIEDWEHRTAGDPELRTWMRFRPDATFDDSFLDAGRLAIMVDTFQWPAATRAYAAGELTHYAPSLDLACFFHRDGSDAEWLLVDAVAPVAGAGLVGGASRVWDRDGRLLASGGQQMLCRPAQAP